MGNTLALLTMSILFAGAAAAADAKAGEAIYMRECSDCHQKNGAPVSSVGKSMQKQGVKMLDLRDAEVQAHTDDQWKKQIVEGVGKMKPVKGLSTGEVDNVIAFIRILKKK